jgi:hypothetical protein
MSHHVLEFDEECHDCRGTGVYKGMAEREGFAVECYSCKGTGKHHAKYEYDDFSGKKMRENISTVIKTNPGIVVGIDETCGITKEHFGGMSYEEWFNGKPFPLKSEMRKYTCPAWWYQSADYKLKPDWDWCNLSLGRTFSQCRYFDTKEKCWERFDKEQSK